MNLADLVLPVVPVFRFSLEAPEAPGGQVGLRLRDFAYSVALKGLRLVYRLTNTDCTFTDCPLLILTFTDWDFHRSKPK